LQNDSLTLTFQKIKAATDITCSAEVASNLTGTWPFGCNDVEQLWQFLNRLTTQTINAQDKIAVPNVSNVSCG
jgi:hypothetical protein